MNIGHKYGQTFDCHAAEILRDTLLIPTAGCDRRCTSGAPEMVRSVRQEVRRAPARENRRTTAVALRQDDLIEECHAGVLGLRLRVAIFSLADEFVES